MEDTKPSLKSVITPARWVTNVHLDFMFSGVITLILFGHKVFFFWPSTAHNLEYFRKHERTGGKTGGLDKAVTQMTGGWMRFFKEGDAFYNPAGQLHAVLSLSDSAITGYLAERPENLEKGYELAVQQLEWCKDPEYDAEDVSNIIEETNTQLNYLESKGKAGWSPEKIAQVKERLLQKQQEVLSTKEEEL